LRYAKVSSPAPTTRYWRTPAATQRDSSSSTKRLRATNAPRRPRDRGSFSEKGSSRNAASVDAPSKGSAIGSGKTSGSSSNWCTARSEATLSAERLGSPRRTMLVDSVGMG
jgi:hypothetical protein